MRTLLQQKVYLSSLALLVSMFSTGLYSQEVHDDAAAEKEKKFTENNVASCLDVNVEKMKCIPAGFFLRGDDHHRRSARPQEKIELDVYWMDTYEVTTADYRTCIKSGKCKKAGPNYSNFSAPQQPITGVNWFHADAFCRAQGKHLPTEAEWEKAARGPEGATYSWGNERATCKRAILKNHKGRSCGRLKKGRSGKPDVGRPEKVGSRPAGAYGLYDMAGNSWEWVADWASSSYAKCGDACRGKNPKGPCDGKRFCKGHTKRSVRGGSWYWPAAFSTAFHRRSHVPNNRPFHHFGFRCAASLQEARLLSAGKREPEKNVGDD